MCQGIVIDFSPVALYEGRYQQQQRALRLMEVGHHGLDNLVVIPRGNDNLGTGVQGLHPVAVQVVQDGLQGRWGGDALLLGGQLIGLPLADVQFFFGGIGMIHQGQSDVIEAFQGAYGSRSDGDGLSLVSQQLHEGLSGDGDILRVHLVAFYFFAFDRFEGAGSHVQGQFLQVRSLLAQGFQYAGREVQSGCRGSYRAFDFRVNRLVGHEVALLRLPVEVGRDG